MSKKRKSVEGSASEGKTKCLMESNFTEIKGLIEFVNGVLVKRINELEEKVSVLTKAVEAGTIRTDKKLPLFNLELDDGDEESSDTDEFGQY